MQCSALRGFFRQSLILTLALTAGLTSTARAEVNTRIDVELSLSASGFQFSHDMAWLPNGSVHVDVRVSVSYIGTGSPVGLARLLFQPTVGNFNAGNSTDTLHPLVSSGGNTTTPSGAVPDAMGAYGRVSPWASMALNSSQRLFGHVHYDGAAGAPAGRYLRIAQAQATSWMGGTGNTTGNAGIPISQLNNVGRTAADPAFEPGLQNLHVFRFGLTFDQRGGPAMTHLIDIPALGLGTMNTATGEREVWWWGSMDETSPSIRGTAIVNPATFRWVLPSPATLLPFATGVALTARRRRAAT